MGRDKRNERGSDIARPCEGAAVRLPSPHPTTTPPRAHNLHTAAAAAHLDVASLEVFADPRLVEVVQRSHVVVASFRVLSVHP